MLDEKTVKSILIKKHNYDRKFALQTIEDIIELDEDIFKAAEQFIYTDEIMDIFVDPCSVVSLIETYGLNPIAAYMFINWLRKEPNKALQCLGLGFDEIIDIENAEVNPKEKE